jgi:nanoRNase/pAp phosphatase (c-di-AMP/oligoRNAs hydrolase)
MGKSASELVRRFYNQFSGEDQVLILINADPDAIASAMAIKRLLWRKVLGVTITCINQVDRPDNLAMIRLLGVKLVYIEDLNISRFNRFAIVDSQPAHHELLSQVDPHVIIDHHPETGAQAPFQDIRPHYGAVASIMTEYLRAAKIKPSAKLATGLYLAIKTDTHDFEQQAIAEDVQAFQYLFKYINRHLARKIEQSELKLEYLKYFKRAFQNMRRRQGRVFVHLGSVANPDICVLIADFFMRVNSINWSIVSGLYDRKLILIFRNDGLRMNAGKVAQKSFGELGSAGGHKSMARAEIPTNKLKLIDTRDDAKLLKWIMRQVIEGPNT